jgi:hypothetical protein|nr:MAG TPA: hypothetical protein [Bacteriophage sp.]
MHIERMHKMIECLTEKALNELEKGVENVDTHEMGAVIDMIKDLNEAEYRAVITKEMKEADEEEEEYNKELLRVLKAEYGEEGGRRYYDRYRYANGRFAPKGRGTRTTGRRGYDEPPYWHMTPEMYYEWADMPEEERMRDLDRLRFGRMYYSDPRRGSQMPSDGRSVEDMGMKSESRYDRARRSYSETKDMHKANTKEDNDANMRGLESLLAVIDEDLKEIMPGLSASEKTMMKTKMTNWVQRI